MTANNANASSRVNIENLTKSVVGTVLWGRTCRFTDDTIVTAPLANTVDAETFFDVYVAGRDAPVTVTINASGSDLFDDGTITDAQLVLSFAIGGVQRITSNGSNRLEV